MKKIKSCRQFVVATIAIVLWTAVGAYAQDEKKGWEEIPEVSVDVVKIVDNDLPPANRNFEKIPPRPSEPIKPPMMYSFQSFNFNAPLINPQIRPLKLKASSPSDIYGNFVQVGYGNYGSPLLEAYLNSRKDKNKLLGAHFYHHSSAKGPVDGKNSGNGITGLDLSARSVGESLSAAGNFAFENRATHFYGYPDGAEVGKDSLKQSFNQFRLSGEVANSKNSEFSYKLGAGFGYMSDKYKAKESEFDIDFSSGYDISDESKINFVAGFYGISRKDALVEAKPRSLFFVKPSYVFIPAENFKLSAGFNLAFENDSISKKDLHIYPDVNVSYTLSPSVDLVGYLTGGMEKVSLSTLSHENMWLAPNVGIFHTNKAIDIGFGLNARLGNKVAAFAGFGTARLKDWYFFVNDPSDQSKFQVAYDNATRTNFYAALSYAQSETAKFMLRGDVYSYSVSDLDVAWHRPTYKLTVNGSLNVYEKLIFSADLIAQGGMKAINAEGKNTTLKAAFDLNFKTEYLFSKSLSAFILLNNIAGSKYPIYQYYPVRGLQVTAGVTWSF